MELSELQQRVDAWIRQYGVRYFSELTNMAVLTEEVGELARIMARKYGDQSFKEGEKCDLADEMADVLWGTCMPCEPDGCSPSRRQWWRFQQENLAATKSGTCTIRSSDPEKPPVPGVIPKPRPHRGTKHPAQGQGLRTGCPLMVNR